MNIFVVIKQWTSWLAIFELCWFFFKCFSDYFFSFAITCGEEFWCVNLRGIKKEEVNRPSLTHPAIWCWNVTVKTKNCKTHLQLEDTSLMCDFHGHVLSFFKIMHFRVNFQKSLREMWQHKKLEKHLGYRLWAVPKSFITGSGVELLSFDLFPSFL